MLESTEVDPGNIYLIVDQIDDVIRRAFDASSVGEIERNPVLRFRVFPLLLKGLGAYAPGNDESQVRQELLEYIGIDGCNTVDQCGDDLKRLLREQLGVNPTYSAASYWSPMDGRRHTVTHRPSPATPGEQTHVLANAYAFYALTLAGAKHGLYSVIHYTSEGARNKRGVRVSYQAECPSGWWHIPPNVHEDILGQTGLTGAIQRVVLKGQRKQSELEKLLRLTLDNTESAGWVNVQRICEELPLILPE